MDHDPASFTAAIRERLAEALASSERHLATMQQLNDDLLAEVGRIEGLHEEQIASLRTALVHRDVIGQAKD